MSRHKRIINVKVLPGEPTDGTGRVCIHLFVHDEAGPFAEPHALHPVLDDNGVSLKGQVAARETRGRLACDPKRGVAPITRNGVTTITYRSDEVSVVTCPRCKASREYLERMPGDTQSAVLAQ